MKLLASTKAVVAIVSVVLVDVEAVVGVPVRVRNVAISVAYHLISSISPEIFFKISCVPPVQTGFIYETLSHKMRQAVSLYVANRYLFSADRFKSHSYYIKNF